MSRRSASATARNLKKRAAKDSFAATAAHAARNRSIHGLQPWLHSFAAPRLKSSSKGMLRLRRSRAKGSLKNSSAVSPDTESGGDLTNYLFRGVKLFSILRRWRSDSI